MKEINIKDIEKIIKNRITKYGPIKAIRISSAGGMTSRRNNYSANYYGLVVYQITVSKKGYIIAKAQGRADKTFWNEDKAIEAAKSYSKGYPIIHSLGTLDVYDLLVVYSFIKKQPVDNFIKKYKFDNLLLLYTEVE